MKSKQKKFFASFVSSLFVSFVLLILSNCNRNSDWVQFRGEGGRNVSNSRITPPLGVRWEIKLQTGDELIRSLNPPVVMGDTIYFGSDDGNFYALDVESGYMRWVFKSGAEINSIPYADKDKVYFGSKDGKLYALSRETGQEVWTFQTGSQINSQVQGYGDYIVFVGDADAFYFLSKDGIEQFTIDNHGWYNVTFILQDDILYNAFGPRSTQGPYDIYKKEFLWYMDSQNMDAIWFSPSAIKGDVFYMGTADVTWDGLYLGYHAFNRHTGEVLWREYRDAVSNFRQFEEVWDFFLRNIDILDFMSPTVWRDLVIFTGGDNTARAFDANTGLQRWETVFNTTVSSAPTLASGRVYFGLMGDSENPPKLMCISARNGQILWEMETEGSILSAPVIAGKRIVFGTDKSVFYVIERIF